MSDINNLICCKRFKECVTEGEIVKAKELDETEWYIPEWHHIYFCPFCGTFIQGKGFGSPSKRC